MACACKVNQKLNYIQKKYGNNVPGTSKNKEFSVRPGILLEGSVIVLLQVLLIPVFFIMIVYRGLIKKKPISVRRILHVGK